MLVAIIALIVFTIGSIGLIKYYRKEPSGFKLLLCCLFVTVDILALFRVIEDLIKKL